MEIYYQDEWAKIIHGDCREVLPTLESVDLVLTDPPYGINENAHRIASRGKLAATTDYGKFDWDKKPAADDLIELSINKGKSAIIWGGNYFQVPPSRGWFVWDKQNGDNDFADCELAWTNLKTSVRIFRFLWNGMLRAGQARGVKRVHPTQKPVELMRWCIGFAPEVKTILDPFMGSGTTLRAAKDLGIHSIGIELNEEYCEAAASRLRQSAFAFTPPQFVQYTGWKQEGLLTHLEMKDVEAI
jgi:DNA modification methylase